MVSCMPKKNFIGYFSTLRFCFLFSFCIPRVLAPEDILIVRRAGSKKQVHGRARRGREMEGKGIIIVSRKLCTTIIIGR